MARTFVFVEGRGVVPRGEVASEVAPGPAWESSAVARERWWKKQAWRLTPEGRAKLKRGAPNGARAQGATP